MEKNYDFDKMVEDLDEYELSLDSHSDDTDEEYVTCVWCGEEYPESDCRLEADLGYLCSRCISAIKSRGETLTFVENLDKCTSVTEDLDSDFYKAFRAKCFNAALEVAKAKNCPVIYAYTSTDGKFNALGIDSLTCDPANVAASEAIIRREYPNCNVVYVAYPDRSYIKLEALSPDLKADAKEKIKAAVNQVFDEAKEPLYADVFDANLFTEPEETPIKQFACYFRDEYLGDVSAKDADEAYAAMEERWPFLPYDEYDGIAEVEELVEDCVHSDTVEEDFAASPAKTLADVMDFSDYQTIEDLIDGDYPDYEIEYDDLDVEIESEGCEDYYDPSDYYGHGQRCWTNYGKLNHWTYLAYLTINDFADFLHKPIDAITLDEVKRINANDFDNFVAERYRAEAEKDAEENWDDDDVSWDDDYGYPDYDDWDD